MSVETYYVLESGERHEAGQIEGIYPTLKDAKQGQVYYSGWKTIIEVVMCRGEASRVRREWYYNKARGWGEIEAGSLFRFHGDEPVTASR